MRKVEFEFHAYTGDDDGNIVENAKVTFLDLEDKSSARSKAGALAKKINGPVDFAYSGQEPWNDRYLGTASPSPYHTAKYRIERLS